MRKITAALVGALMAFGLLGAASASAGVERYQFTDVELDILANNVPSYDHHYTLRHNPCTNSWTVSEAWGSTSGAEELSNISLSGNQVSFLSTYEKNGYTYTATIVVAEDGTVSMVTGSGSGGVSSATGTGSITQTSYNHGEYVAESIDDYGPDAHSCIGKPVVSKR